MVSGEPDLDWNDLLLRGAQIVASQAGSVYYRELDYVVVPDRKAVKRMRRLWLRQHKYVQRYWRRGRRQC